MANSKRITLCWYAKTPQGWQYFPAIVETFHNTKQVKQGWVKEGVKKDGGQLVEYPHGRYVLRSYVAGRKVYTPVEATHPRDAVIAWQKAQKVSIASGPARNPKAVIKTAVPAYIRDCEQRGAMEAASQARIVLKEFTPLCNVDYVRGITREMIFDFHKALKARGMSARTIANKDARVRSWLKFCEVDTKFLPPKPKFEETLPTIYNPSEIKAILGYGDDYMGIVIRMALMLGLREQEIVYAEWPDIDWHHSVFRVQGKKVWKFEVKDYAQRDVPIPSELLSILKTWQETRKGASLIVGNDKDKPEGHLLRKLKQLARKAGLNCGKCDGCNRDVKSTQECEQWFLHKFRATFCTRMLRQADAKTVQALAGHSDLETTLAYLAPATGPEMQAHANAIKWTE